MDAGTALVTMSIHLSLQDVKKSFGARTLFSGITLNISQDERIGLIGANGCGKSTLLKILAGEEKPDSGERVLSKQTKLAYLPQEDLIPQGRTVEDIVAEPLHHLGLPEAELFTRVGVYLGKTGFENREQKADTLSGGWRKRLALARELAKEPDVLLLDEPTNHLDLESILWLEQFLMSLRTGFILVSHDRYFLENVTNRTIELGPAYPEGYLSVNAPYSSFLEKRDDFLRTQAGYEATLANKVRREVEWLRRGPKARSTKAKYRKDEAGRLQQELAQTRQRNRETGRAQIDFTATDKKSKRLVVAESITKELGGKTLFKDLDVVLSPGVRVGLVGLNGSGKTTLLRVLGEELAADAGKISKAPGLNVVTFDQNREQLDTDIQLRTALSPHGDNVVYRDRALHVVSWAKRFLFKPDQLNLPVGLLSGGEQARILIARLMLKPADVLLLDEPTNNLDIQTLEVLEESLLDFPGAVVLISHDRYLLDRVSTVMLGLDGKGNAEVFADYAQWDTLRKEQAKAAAKVKTQAGVPAKSKKNKAKKLSFNEQREWDAMEETIHAAEERLEECQKVVEEPAVATDPGKLQDCLARMEEAQAGVDQLYERWEELEAKVNAFES